MLAASSTSGRHFPTYLSFILPLSLDVHPPNYLRIVALFSPPSANVIIRHVCQTETSERDGGIGCRVLTVSALGNVCFCRTNKKSKLLHIERLMERSGHGGQWLCLYMETVRF